MSRSIATTVGALAVVAFASATAVAGHHGSHGSYGSYGSHGSYGSYGSHGSYGSYGSHGSWGGYHGHYAHYHGSYGSYGSHGSYGSYGSYGSHGSSGGGSVYYSVPSGGGGIYYQGTPSGGGGAVQQQQTPAQDLPDLPAIPGAAKNSSGDATLMVNVPAGTKIYVNDRETTSVGTSRKYVSKNLQAGYKYRYEIRAVANVDGQQREETQVINLRAGQSVDVNFDMNEAPAVADQESAEDKVQTKLTVKVPAGAEVFLAGQATQSQGATRTFATSKLSAGQAWANYTVKATLNRDGQQLTKEQTLTLVGGEDREIAFDFSDVDVAAVAASTR